MMGDLNELLDWARGLPEHDRHEWAGSRCAVCDEPRPGSAAALTIAMGQFASLWPGASLPSMAALR